MKQTRNRCLLETLHSFISLTIAIGGRKVIVICSTHQELSLLLNLTSNGQKLEKLCRFKVAPGFGQFSWFASKATCRSRKNDKILFFNVHSLRFLAQYYVWPCFRFFWAFLFLLRIGLALELTYEANQESMSPGNFAFIYLLNHCDWCSYNYSHL